jgi:(p)ppGpp synthase/HD superfamily hydrolase
VAGTLRELGLATVELETVAWLHDTLEDTWTRPSDLEARFGPRVRRLVGQLTKPASGQFAAHISRREKDAFAVKLADRLANVGR